LKNNIDPAKNKTIPTYWGFLEYLYGPVVINLPRRPNDVLIDKVRNAHKNSATPKIMRMKAKMKCNQWVRIKVFQLRKPKIR
jgi:hypothetical protein